jgi:hypothetical protein
MTNYATFVTIDPIGAVPLNGSLVVTPSSSTLYILIATGPSGTEIRKIHIGVQRPFPPLPPPTKPNEAKMSPPAPPEMPPQRTIDDLNWCMGNWTYDPGETNCFTDASYLKYPTCVANGGRACLMRIAIQSAHDNDCNNAYALSLTCQCHNGDASAAMAAAGEQKVCDYLKTQEPPQ